MPISNPTKCSGSGVSTPLLAGSVLRLAALVKHPGVGLLGAGKQRQDLPDSFGLLSAVFQVEPCQPLPIECITAAERVHLSSRHLFEPVG